MALVALANLIPGKLAWVGLVRLRTQGGVGKTMPMPQIIFKSKSPAALKMKIHTFSILHHCKPTAGLIAWLYHHYSFVRHELRCLRSV